MNCIVNTPKSLSLQSTCDNGGLLFSFMFLIETYLQRTCQIDNARERITERVVDTPDNYYDFIVVGGGSAGSVVAARLSENPGWKILLLEAGGDEPLGSQIPCMFMSYMNSEINWKFKTEPEPVACQSMPNKQCDWPRGKVLGGTSVINGMMYMRGNKEDFDDWAAMGNPGWSFDDVLPFFKMSENNLEHREDRYHSKKGIMPVMTFPTNPPMSYDILEGAKELGYGIHDLNADNATGFNIAQTTSLNGVRMSSARTFLRPAKCRKNLHIMLNTLALRVLITNENGNKKARGIEVIDKFNNKRKIFATKEVIISGGAVNSPHVLLLSGIGDQNELKKIGVSVNHHLPGVGKNLQNHVAFPLKFNINEPDTRLLNASVAFDYILHQKGLMSGTGISDVTGKIISSQPIHENAPDIQFFFSGYLAACSENGGSNEMESNGNRSIYMYPVVLNPLSRGSISLKSSNPLHYPKINANYLTENRDIKVLIEAIRFAIKLSKTKALQKYGMELDARRVPGCENLPFDSDEYWQCAIKQETGPENHQAGSCKMGPKNDSLAVVDHELRVHGISNLRVMDTSIMPNVTSGNTYAPAVMIAEKGVHHIKEQWKKDFSNNYYHDNDDDDDDDHSYEYYNY